MQVLTDLKRFFFTRARIASVGQERPLLTRSGAGAPELQSLGHVNDRGGNPLAMQIV